MPLELPVPLVPLLLDVSLPPDVPPLLDAPLDPVLPLLDDVPVPVAFVEQPTTQTRKRTDQARMIDVYHSPWSRARIHRQVSSAPRPSKCRPSGRTGWPWLSIVHFLPGHAKALRSIVSAPASVAASVRIRL